ncbi:CREB-regulated transcription coactivator 1-like isoform X1 [Schistocerca americana]|uniref:CREB-regulated transcription coactivator 1-like isoform X1 n=1 Tax=Schistocerca americana TaxID=7009 RepID=UPI001F4F6481|nr:CREB-regulated transcription coactivator 1-like isoform X1 [Schistocerca americana]
MANPRKFSEKIALHNQKQAEETAAFEQIMKEVSDATSKVNALPKQHLLINQSRECFLGGSLPNVNHIGSDSVDLKSALSSLEEMKAGRGDGTYQERGRRMGVGPMRSRPAEKRIDTSPYSSSTYLSPPPDTSWRRTNSDSALHQSAMATTTEAGLSSQRRVADGSLLGLVVVDPADSNRKPISTTVDGRPRSSCEVPRVPGINIYPSQHEPGTVQIPIGNNTGSLPDLTSFHFPPPLPTPLDQEDHSSSPYSTSPQGASPSTLSPTSLASRPTGRFSFTGSPQDSQGPSPGHSPSARRRHYHQPHLQNLVMGGPQSPGSLAQATNHLSVPSHVNSRYLHTCKGVTVDSTTVPLDNFSQQQGQYIYQQPQQVQQAQAQPPSPQQQQQQQQQMQQQTQQQSPQQQASPLGSPNLVSNSKPMPSVNHAHLNSLNTYRSPQPLTRPSPQTSPGLLVQGANVYRSASPGDTSHSGPQSPVSPASSPGIGPSTSPFLDHNSYGFTQAQANALQQHFEQFSMVDNPVPTSISYINSQQSNTTNYSQAINHGSPVEESSGLTQISSQELNAADHGYYSQSPSQLHYNRPVAVNPSGGSTQQTTPQTPNTPSSIPDIILTDFSSSTGDDLSRQEFVKDLGSAMSGSFDDSELFPSDETLREGLDPIDFDGLQMLTDPDMNVITDPSTEDNFRIDRLQ